MYAYGKTAHGWAQFSEILYIFKFSDFQIFKLYIYKFCDDNFKHHVFVKFYPVIFIIWRRFVYYILQKCAN